MSGEPKILHKSKQCESLRLVYKAEQYCIAWPRTLVVFLSFFLLAIRRQPLSLEWLEEPRSDRLFYEDFFMGTEKLDSRVPSVA